MLDGVVNGTKLGSVSIVFVRYGGTVVVVLDGVGRLARAIDASWRHVGAILAAPPSVPPVAVTALESMLVDAILLGTPHSHASTLLAPRGGGS